MNFKKQLASTMATLALGAALIGGGTFAYFSDTATSSGNTFATGTIDIHTKFAAVPFAVSNAKPSDIFAANFNVQNTGTLNANASFKFDYTATDGASDGSDLGQILKITKFQYGGADIAITDANNNGRLDLNDIKGQTFQLGQVDANTTDANAKQVVIEGVFEETNTPQNEYQGDSLTGTFTFEAMQQ